MYLLLKSATFDPKIHLNQEIPPHVLYAVHHLSTRRQHTLYKEIFNLVAGLRHSTNHRTERQIYCIKNSKMFRLWKSVASVKTKMILFEGHSLQFFSLSLYLTQKWDWIVNVSWNTLFNSFTLFIQIYLTIYCHHNILVQMRTALQLHIYIFYLLENIHKMCFIFFFTSNKVSYEKEFYSIHTF